MTNRRYERVPGHPGIYCLAVKTEREPFEDRAGRKRMRERTVTTYRVVVSYSPRKGHPAQEKATVRGGIEDAVRVRNELLEQVQRVPDRDVRRITVASAVEAWEEAMTAGLVMTNRRGLPLRPLSVRRYKQEARLVILPKLGDYLLVDLERDPGPVEDLIATRPTPASEASTASALGAFFRWATQPPRRWIKTNPAHGARHRTAESNVADRCLDKDDALRLLQAAAGDPLEAAIVLGFPCGLRIGEVSAMTWDDIDLDVGTITVRSSGHGGPTKSGRGSRTFSLPDLAIPRLREAKARQAEHLARLGLPQDDQTPVVTNRQGGRFLPNSLSSAFRRWPGLAGFGAISFHTLRHSTASLALLRGIDVVTVAGLLGDSVSTIQSTYLHFLPSGDRAAASGWSAFIESETVVSLPRRAEGA